MYDYAKLEKSGDTDDPSKLKSQRDGISFM